MEEKSYPEIKPYPKTYLWEATEAQGIFFDRAQDIIPAIDMVDFMTRFMRSKFRALMDEGHPHYLTRFGHEMMDVFKEMDNFEPVLATEENLHVGHGWAADWTGRIYSLLQWATHIPSKDLVELVPVDDMLVRYGGLHDLDWCLAVGRIVHSYGLPCRTEDTAVCDIASYW